MTARSRRPISAGPLNAAPSPIAEEGDGWSRGQASSPSNSQMQERLREVRGVSTPSDPVRSDPQPWAAQQRSVSFSSVQGGELFRDGASPTDVVQGRNGSRYLGDCWLLGSMAAIAHTRPQLLEQAITDHGDGTYTVRLHGEGRDGELQAEDVRVQGSLPHTADGRDAYAQRQDPQELWVGIVEKAFAVWKGGYGQLDGGIPGDALTALTGQRSHTSFTEDTGAEELGGTLREAAGAGQPMVAASRADLSLERGGIVPGHAHTVLAVDEEGGQTWLTLRDPFARYEPGGNGPRDGVFRVTLDEFRQRFQYTSWTEGE